jgi:deoxyribodipyrimidine photo-lyase
VNTIDKRSRLIQEGKKAEGPVIYWMSRDQRINDNWALLYAQRLAFNQKSPLIVAFCLVPDFLEATIRQYGFMLRGLQELEAGLHKKNIPFILATGAPGEQIPRLVKQFGAACLITDFDPLRIKMKWVSSVSEKIRVPFYQVDTHNIVPCWLASPKQEYAAYTFRPKIRRFLPEFLNTFPTIRKHPFPLGTIQKPVDWSAAQRSLKVNSSVREIKWLRPGEKAAESMLRTFLKNKILSYENMRNDPTRDGQSDLSPYLHFGQISAQRVALEVQKLQEINGNKDAFLEELIVRRELSDNFCFYNDHYDSFKGFPSWAKESLDKYRKKPREYVYSLRKFEQARTHDELWNAAQQEMVSRGKMHGYMRMYWAKKILEWTESPERALKIAIYLNDKYELDGRDPNGYAGIAWSIGGVHDRAWNERRVFGKVRYMSYNGCKGKFDVTKYVQMNKQNEKIPFNKKIGSVDVHERLRYLDKKQLHAVLATDSGGQPYTSLVAYALIPDMKGLLFATPQKTTKYKNIQKNRNVSVMIDTRQNTGKGYMESEAVTILGTASIVRRGSRRDELAPVLSEKHPELAGFVNAASTVLILVSFDKVIHAGKFQTVTAWEKEQD